jgi:integrase/recombinase XerD
MAVRKRGKGWIIDISLCDRKRLYHTFHGTEEEAWEMEHAMRRELNRQKPFDKLTVATLVPQYLEHVKLHQSPVTYESKKKMLYSHIIPHFGNVFADSIPDVMVRQYKTKRKGEIASKVAKGGNRAINLELLCLAALCKWAGYPLKFEQLPYRATMPNILSNDEVKSLIEAMEPFYRAFFTCLYGAGMRKKEVFTLTWDRVSFESKSIVVVGKGDRIRLISMHPAVYEALLSHKMSRTGDNPLVFPSKRTGGQLVDIRRAIERAKKKAEIEKRIYPHLLRHCFGTHVYNITGDLQGISKIMGHGQLSTTQIYAKLSQEHQRDIIEKGIDL